MYLYIRIAITISILERGYNKEFNILKYCFGKKETRRTTRENVIKDIGIKEVLVW